MFRYLTSFFASLVFGALFFGSLGLAAPAHADVTLLMGEEPGCIWCARWNEEIGHIYEKTDEGVAAPLRRIDITDPLPDDITLARSINFTPTFVLLIDGAEVSRVEGYAGEDFFWGLLARMLDQNDISYTIKSNEDAGGL